MLNLRTLDTDEKNVGEEGDVWYTLTITNLEVRRMFRKMVQDWFENDAEVYYNEFFKALLNDNVKKMNTFMNKVALNTFSSFDSGNKPSGQAFIIEFKVLDPDEDEKTLEDTLVNARAQIEEKQYEAELISAGFLPDQIRKYGFAFRGKECLIG